jgi:ABC-type bacteriocin/lantibiotic exporter with double-glycine peptidase domain
MKALARLEAELLAPSRAIGFIKEGREHEHSAARFRRRITIHDPAAGRRTLTLEEASKHFTGVVLELTPSTNLTPLVARGTLPLWALWSALAQDASIAPARFFGFARK